MPTSAPSVRKTHDELQADSKHEITKIDLTLHLFTVFEFMLKESKTVPHRDANHLGNRTEKLRTPPVRQPLHSPQGHQ